MRIPFITPRKQTLGRRKGGGGGGKGSGSSGGGGGGGSGINKGGSVGGGSTAGKTSSVSTPNIAGGRSSATAYGNGGGSIITIPAGQAFAGRSAGGGARTQVYGSNVYGSGYPGVSGRGVAGRGLPFFFWPVVWGGAAVGSAAYLHDSNEYGNPDNSTRPGGPMAQAAFQSNTTSTIYRIVADNSTVSSLITSINSNCTTFDLGSTTTSPSPYTGASTDPQPEQAIQYYRASSVALTLDGYNNSAALSSNDNATATPLPSGIDTILLGCLNNTIGLAVPLVDGAGTLGVPSVGLIALLWVVMAAFQRL